MNSALKKSVKPLRGQKVRVIANDGREYIGWLERIDYNGGHLVLRDAQDVDADDRVDPAHVRAPKSVVGVEPDGRIERVPVDEISPAPYHAREFDRSENLGYIEQVRGDGWTGSYPVARETDGGLEVVEGHKRLWVAEQAGLETHPVRIVDVNDWAAARRFVADHLPSELHVQGDGTVDGYYGAANIADAVATLVERWGDRALELERVAWNVDRLGLDVDLQDDEGETSQEDTSEDSSDDESRHTEDRSDPDPTPEDVDDDLTSEEKVIHALEEYGDLAGSDVQDKTGLDHYAYHLLAQLEEEGRVEKREDPDDGRRTLYTLVDEDRGECAISHAGLEAGEVCSECGHATPLPQPTNVTEESEEEHDGQSEDDPFIQASEKRKSADESDHSTEDDTHQTESESTSEAPDVVLEESDADDAPEETGDVDEDDDSDGLNYCSGCDTSFETSLEYAIHRTEDHGIPLSTLGHLEPGEFEEIVSSAETLQDIVDGTGWSYERTLRALGIYGLEDVVGSNGTELSDITNFDFDGVVDEDLEDDLDEEPDGEQPNDEQPDWADTESNSRSVAKDGGAVAFSDYSASSGNGRRCQNCGAHVDKQFAKVFEPEREGAPRACPNCEDLTRDADGTIRRKRGQGSGGGSA